MLSSVTADVILAGADIESGSGCAFSIEKGASVNLTLTGGNTFKSGNNKGNNNAGLQVTDGASLTITSNSIGSLEADGGKNGAGIGGGNDGSGDIITINGGNVKATGGDSGAGIGSGSNNTISIRRSGRDAPEKPFPCTCPRANNRARCGTYP